MAIRKKKLISRFALLQPVLLGELSINHHQILVFI